ncbi:alpha/beta hydrolase family protein [Streptomyces sp. NPDC049687]|uniref:alpha/beta hydrolase family protein n=1 Tax=Streptomyces sp. NPDC049687 TaxID=3365596 RepID=UPI0037979CF3
MNNLISTARQIPVNESAGSLTVSTLTLPAPDRALLLEVRVTAPATGSNLPIVLLSHGGGQSLYLSSKDGYDPLVHFYAAHGFAVIQPSHLSSKIGGLGLDPNAEGFPIFWRSRIADMKHILDSLDNIEERIPAITGRLDHTNVAAVGHSGGSQTVALLLGARLTDPTDGTLIDEDYTEPRIKSGVLLAAVGNGGDSLTDAVRKGFPELHLDFSHMTTPTLVAYGDEDDSPELTVRGATWHADPYHHGPGADHLLTLFGAKHFLGGIMGYDLKETDDEDPERLAITQRMTWAYLRSALCEGDSAWPQACAALEKHAPTYGRVDSKS